MGTITDYLIDTVESFTPLPEGTIRRAVEAAETIDTEKLAEAAMHAMTGVALGTAAGGFLVPMKGVERFTRLQKSLRQPRRLYREFIRMPVDASRKLLTSMQAKKKESDVCQALEAAKLPLLLQAPLFGMPAILFLQGASYLCSHPEVLDDVKASPDRAIKGGSQFIRTYVPTDYQDATEIMLSAALGPASFILF